MRGGSGAGAERGQREALQEPSAESPADCLLLVPGSSHLCVLLGRKEAAWAGRVGGQWPCSRGPSSRTRDGLRPRGSGELYETQAARCADLSRRGVGAVPRWRWLPQSLHFRACAQAPRGAATAALDSCPDVTSRATCWRCLISQCSSCRAPSAPLGALTARTLPLLPVPSLAAHLRPFSSCFSDVSPPRAPSPVLPGPAAPCSWPSPPRSRSLPPPLGDQTL